MKIIWAILCVSGSCFAQSTNINVRVWGDNSTGQQNVPAGLTNAIAIAGGLGHSLAIKSDGSLVAWGQNDFGQSNIPNNLSNAVAVACGGYSSFVLKSDGSITNWGYLGIEPTPPPSNLTNAIAIAASYYQEIVLKADGSISVFGSVGGSLNPVPTSLTNVNKIAAGLYHALAIKTDGTVLAWGNNGNGQCNVPSNVTSAVAVAGGGFHSLALKPDGTVIAWGYNGHGQTNVPPGLSNVVEIAAGANHSLALKANGQVVAWGQTNNNVPLDLAFSRTIACGFYHSLAIVDSTNSVFPPTILAHPRSQTVGAGSTVYLYVIAKGSLPVSYQWYFNGTNAIAGATNSVLNLINLNSLQSGEYTVVVTNPAGDVTSVAAVLEVLPSLAVSMVPAITLMGGVGLTYSLDYVNAVGSPNTWSNLATITLTNNSQIYFDTSAVGQPARFYRSVQVP